MLVFKLPQRKYENNTLVNCKAMNKTHLEIKSAKWNGFTWMYSFQGTDFRCGEEYLTKTTAADAAEQLARN